MRVKKIINNNVVLAEKDELEYVLMGRGIGFSCGVGEELQQAEILQQFIQIDTDEKTNALAYLDYIPYEFLEIATKISQDVRENLGFKLRDIATILIADHLYFYKVRSDEQIFLTNDLLYEVARIYDKEFAFSKLVLEKYLSNYVKEITEDEAAFLTMHLISGKEDFELTDISTYLSISNDILDIITSCSSITDKLELNRIAVHIRALVQRILMHKNSKVTDIEETIFNNLELDNNMTIINNIKDYLLEQHNLELSNAEKLYLYLHLQRMNKG